MDLNYIVNDTGWSDSLPSSPRSWFGTPPSTPGPWSTDTPITTPGSTKANEYWRLSRDTSSVSPRFGPPTLIHPWSYRCARTQEEALEEIERRRKTFLSAIKDTVRSLIGDSAISDDLVNTEDALDAQVRPHLPLGAQPNGIRATLKPYQLEGLSWLLHIRNNGAGGILADDMGLGKTLQTLSLFQHVKDYEMRTDHRFLVVCPLSVLNTWMSEISKWTTNLTPMAYYGSNEEREALRRHFRQQTGQSVDIVVTSYETLCSDMLFFRKTTWSYVVLDEGHRIKNSRSKRAQEIYKLRAEYKLVLTGTPIQNDLTELWSILRWLYPEIFGPSTAQYFEDAFSLSNGKFNSKFLRNVTRFLKHIMLRRTKISPEIGLDIPPKREIILSVPLTDLQLGWYYKILTGVDRSVLLSQNENAVHSNDQMQSRSNRFNLTPSAKNPIGLAANEREAQGAAATKKSSKITTNILMELRKCSIHPYLLADAFPDDFEIGRHVVENSGKFIILQKMIRQFVVMENKKIIIFSGFDEALNLCEDLLEMEKAQARFEHVRLDGGTSSAWRNLSVFLFQNDPRYKVFLLSIRAGGEGLNLMSSSTVIFLDEDWNPQVMRQAESRVHRLGQTQPVQIFRLHAKGTVEDQMRQRLSKKAYLSAKVIEEPLGDEVCSPDIDTTDEQEIPLMPNRAIVPNALDAGKLVCSDFNTIMQSCAFDESSVQEMSHAEKKAWLERAERVKTDIFNGEKVDTSSRSFSVYKESILGVSRASRRTGKSRVVMIGEWEVSKENIESASSLKSPTLPKQEIDKKPKKSNETTCFLCRRRHAQECDVCTRSFHKDCLDASDDLNYTRKGDTIICPHHYCCKCGKTASQAGSLLFSCLTCPLAYCEHCLDWGRTLFVGNSPDAQMRGYFPSNAFFISCPACHDAAKKRHFECTQPDPKKRARRG